jgi:hypothetical protein
VIVALLLAIFAAYVCIPRKAHLRHFDPNAIATLETTMWREYYEHRKLALALSLYEMSRNQHGFSPLDSVRLAKSAADAAIVFKDSTNDNQADLALPALRKYFQIMRDRGDCQFDVEEAARLELTWWKLRRHNVGPVEYGHAVARATGCIYGITPESIETYAQLRAAAMDLRDRHNASMTESDWQTIESMLRKSFSDLHQSVAG